MKTASVSEIKKELKHLDSEELIELLNQLSRFSKENKEYLHYLLFESDFEANYIAKIKEEIENEFDQLDHRSWRMMKKSIQRIVRLLKKYIKFSKQKETEIELLLFFCQKLQIIGSAIYKMPVVFNIYKRQVTAIEKAISGLHEDVQYDYKDALEEARQVIHSNPLLR